MVHEARSEEIYKVKQDGSVSKLDRAVESVSSQIGFTKAGFSGFKRERCKLYK